MSLEEFERRLDETWEEKVKSVDLEYGLAERTNLQNACIREVASMGINPDTLVERNAVVGKLAVVAPMMMCDHNVHTALKALLFAVESKCEWQVATETLLASDWNYDVAWNALVSFNFANSYQWPDPPQPEPLNQGQPAAASGRGGIGSEVARTAVSNAPRGITCQQCGSVGTVTTKEMKKKSGISGGKATAAVLTGGFSILATGLSRKDKVTQMHCSACGVTWLA